MRYLRNVKVRVVLNGYILGKVVTILIIKGQLISKGNLDVK